MLVDSEVSLTNSNNVTATAVHNGRRRLATNRYTVALLFFGRFAASHAQEKERATCGS